MSMGKIILLIYVIGAVISIISKQKKKKALQRQRNQAENRSETQAENATPSLEKYEAPNHLQQNNNREEPTQSPMERLQSFLKDSFSPPESTPENTPQETHKNREPQKTGKPFNLLHDVAKEFGIVFEEEEKEQPIPVGTQGESNKGRNVDYVMDDFPEGRFFEPEKPKRKPVIKTKGKTKIMGPAKHRPQVSPSLAVSLNSSKTQLLSQLRDRSTFKKAFILKTIIDRPVSLENRIKR